MIQTGRPKNIFAAILDPGCGPTFVALLGAVSAALHGDREMPFL
jgi:hypothetical protein